MKRALELFRFVRDRHDEGERTALVTLTGVTGSAARAPGQHMVVTQNGTAMGSFSGGCVEAAVISEALDVMASGQARMVRFGAGSRYIDIRLPCGGGIDLLFTPDPAIDEIRKAIEALEAREPVTLRMSEAGDFDVLDVDNVAPIRWSEDSFHIQHEPDLRIIILGEGAEPMALHELAAAYGAETLLLTPQENLIEEARSRGLNAHRLRFTGPSEHLVADRWTAVVTLFHDHDWETELILQALGQNPFFIGAMGSRKTHAERQRRLLEAGKTITEVERVIGPVGLLDASRDPQTLALSVMAQIVQTRERTSFV